jgi:hypothetical protein
MAYSKSRGGGNMRPNLGGGSFSARPPLKNGLLPLPWVGVKKPELLDDAIEGAVDLRSSSSLGPRLRGGGLDGKTSSIDGATP